MTCLKALKEDQKLPVEDMIAMLNNSTDGLITPRQMPYLKEEPTPMSELAMKLEPSSIPVALEKATLMPIRMMPSIAPQPKDIRVKLGPTSIPPRPVINLEDGKDPKEQLNKIYARYRVTMTICIKSMIYTARKLSFRRGNQSKRSIKLRKKWTTLCDECE